MRPASGLYVLGSTREDSWIRVLGNTLFSMDFLDHTSNYDAELSNNHVCVVIIEGGCGNLSISFSIWTFYSFTAMFSETSTTRYLFFPFLCTFFQIFMCVVGWLFWSFAEKW